MKFNSEELSRWTPTQTNEFSPESDWGASRQKRTDGGETRDYRSVCHREHHRVRKESLQPPLGAFPLFLPTSGLRSHVVSRVLRRCVDVERLAPTTFKQTSLPPRCFSHQTALFILTLSNMEIIGITFWKELEIVLTLVLFSKLKFFCHILHQEESSVLMVQSTSTQHPLAPKPRRMHVGSKAVNGSAFKRFVSVGQTSLKQNQALSKPDWKSVWWFPPLQPTRSSCTVPAYFHEPLLYRRGLLWAERAVIKEVKHAFKMSVPLLFHTNYTFQWLKGEAEGGKKQLGVKEERQGGNSTTLPGAPRPSLPSAFHWLWPHASYRSYKPDRGRSMTRLGIQTLYTCSWGVLWHKHL